MMLTNCNYEWPPLPYKGLSYFTRDDIPLFAGRDFDVSHCAQALALNSTRVLVLHGSTGCGKSSFLRAGLIPHLETFNFQFLKTEEREKQRAVFIRSTDSPLIGIAEHLYCFISEPFVIAPPDNEIHPFKLDLKSELLNGMDRTAFLNNVGVNPKGMVDVLVQLARRLPSTLVLVIDQGEEVLTLKPGSEGDPSRNVFFDFLVEFVRTFSNLDMKLVIAIRTEYYGRLYQEIYRRTKDIGFITQFYLDVLNKDQLIEAIERPTSIKITSNFGSPREYYHFSFQPGLPQKIAEDLLASRFAGGVLPIMQIVCESLYHNTKPKSYTGSDWEITEDDYKNLRGLSLTVESYLRNILEKLCLQKMISWRVNDEIERWMTILSELAEEQYDGTITTKIQSETYLEGIYEKQKCKLSFNETMSHLAEEEQRIVRVIKVTYPGTIVQGVFYSFGHDAIGLALQKWRIRLEDAQEGNRRLKSIRDSVFRIILFILSIIFLPLGCFLLFISIDERSTGWAVAGGIVLLVGGALMWGAYPNFGGWWQRIKKFFIVHS